MVAPIDDGDSWRAALIRFADWELNLVGAPR